MSVKSPETAVVFSTGKEQSVGLARRRRLSSFFGWGLAWACAGLVVGALVDLLVTIIIKGVTSFRWDMLTTVTHGVAGGLQNAILGTLWLVCIAIVIAAPVGILGGVYLAEFARTSWARAVRFWTEVLSGVPSIVVGYFVYLLLVLGLGWGFSALAAGIALVIIMLPYIVTSTDSTLRQVPWSLREGAWALGLTRFQAVSRVVWRPAAGGIATGLLTSIAVALGETAPLLYTAGWSAYNPDWRLTHSQVGYLTYVVWTYIEQPYPEAHALAYSAAFLLLVVIVCIHVLVRILVRRWGGGAPAH
ncbi:phosphate ABC transporter permease PstA [Alicyclobacillus shizuokensis]|uniref:phosphate ABC transporter permease PstA n=1 Tax=Alicyclobacillus shizuokensis TaxID=392014 RepID=UPI0009F86B37|nr:phosphate ABC transporter permease PstA [Alicyclobacillus shizuokensis]